MRTLLLLLLLVAVAFLALVLVAPDRPPISWMLGPIGSAYGTWVSLAVGVILAVGLWHVDRGDREKRERRAEERARGEKEAKHERYLAEFKGFTAEMGGVTRYFAWDGPLELITDVRQAVRLERDQMQALQTAIYACTDPPLQPYDALAERTTASLVWETDADRRWKRQLRNQKTPGYVLGVIPRLGPAPPKCRVCGMWSRDGDNNCRFCLERHVETQLRRG